MTHPHKLHEWVVGEALAFASILELAANSVDCHIALTGGCLYKSGGRKDADFLLYRHSKPDMKEEIDIDGFFDFLERHYKIIRLNGMDRCHKGQWGYKTFDILLETRIGQYADQPTSHTIDEVVDVSPF